MGEPFRHGRSAAGGVSLQSNSPGKAGQLAGLGQCPSAAFVGSPGPILPVKPISLPKWGYWSQLFAGGKRNATIGTGPTSTGIPEG